MNTRLVRQSPPPDSPVVATLLVTVRAHDMSKQALITAYPSGDEVPLQGNVITLESGNLVVECMVCHIIVIPTGDKIKSFHMWDVDQEHLVLAEALSLAGGDPPSLIRTIAVQDYLDSYDSATWYSVPIGRQNILALIAAGYTPSQDAVDAIRELMPSPHEIAALKSSTEAFVTASLESARTRYNEPCCPRVPQAPTPESRPKQQGHARRVWWRFWKRGEERTSPCR